jgi:exodeoxyribonuclease VII large subunit
MLVGDRPQRILTVSELTALVRDRLESAFPDLWFEGEVSNLRTPASGHLYFTLKDEASQIRAVLFRAGAQRLRFALKEGLHLVVRGRLTLYEPRGEYQAVLDYLEPKGVGALQLALEQLKEKLTREGLFDPARKRPLPFLPSRVGLVTSPSGAAIRDILVVLGRRCPSLHVVICPVPVQGDGAAPLIAEGIRTLSESGLVEVIIVGRGGGSLEDLWSFNEEAVVRAIVASSVPVISAVGHEIDYTLADFAADFRAATPSAAAEAVAPVLADLVRTFDVLRSRAGRAMRSRLTLARRRAVECDGSLSIRMLPIQSHAQRLDELTGRLGWTVRDVVSSLRHGILAWRHDLGLESPAARVRGAGVLVQQLLKRTEERMRGVLAFRRQAAGSLMSTLDSLSPLSILARGYGIIQTVPEGTVIKKATEVSLGDDVRARLAEGQLLCTVRKVVES